MKINSIKLINFRNHENLKIEFMDINLIFGNNGVGKTSVVEAIYYSCFLRSFKSRHSHDLINFNHENASIELNLSTENDSSDLVQINLYKQKKKVFQNQKNIVNYVDYLGQYNVILISPDNIDIVNDLPKTRRRYLDLFISQLNKKYLKTYIKYSQYLKIKNNFLKSDEIDDIYYNLITKKLKELDDYLYDTRISVLKEIEKEVQKIFTYINDDKTKISIQYKRESKQNLLEYEYRFSKTGEGIHLDDFIFNYNEQNLKVYGSQGQKRMISILFFLSQNIFLKEKKIYPPIIFDDVHLDLDFEKQQKLQEYLKDKNQIIYLTTNKEKMNFISDKTVNIIDLNSQHLK